MRLLIGLLLAALLASGADDPWNKVRQLKSGGDLRVFKKGAKQPVMAKMDEATDDSLIVVLKNEQVAIPKEDVDRIDYRAPQSGSHVVKESRTTVSHPEQEPPPIGVPQGANVPRTSNSGGVTFGSKGEFETVYRRFPAPLPTPAAQH